MSRAGVFKQVYTDLALTQNQSTRSRSSSRTESNGQSATTLCPDWDQELGIKKERNRLFDSYQSASPRSRWELRFSLTRLSFDRSHTSILTYLVSGVSNPNRGVDHTDKSLTY